MTFFELSSTIVKRHRAWSDQTFGARRERGPISSLKHLAKEVKETLAEPHSIDEYADMQFLLMDALHRAGFDCADLNEAMSRKLPVLESRVYPKTAAHEPSEHLRE